MVTTVWLKVGAKKKYGNWKPGTTQAFKTKPQVNDLEVAFKLTLEIPDEIFEEPVFEAKLVLPKVTNRLPEKTEIMKSVAAELTKQMGFKVKLEMPAEEISQ